MMFIIVHQTSELWMRLFRHEMAGVLECVQERQPRSVVQDARAHLARADPTHGDVGRALDHDARRVLRVPERAGALVGLPVASVPAARVHAGEQASGDGRRALGAITEAQEQLRTRSEAPVALRRSAPAFSAGAVTAFPSRTSRATSPSRIEANKQVAGAWLGVYHNAEKDWDLYELAERLVDLDQKFQLWRCASREDGGAHHRPQARHGRHERRELSDEGARAQVLSGAVVGAGVDVAGAAAAAELRLLPATRAPHDSPATAPACRVDRAARARPSSPASSSATRRGWRSRTPAGAGFCQLAAEPPHHLVGRGDRPAG